jgi:vancomycin resistance protein YoaR
MNYVVIDGQCGWGEKGTIVELDDSAIIATLVRSGVVELADEVDLHTETVTEDSAETVELEIPTPIAIIEAMKFEVKKELDIYAEEEHGIKLDRRKSLEKMQNDFCDKYQAKMQKIEIQNKSLTGAPENK